MGGPPCPVAGDGAGDTPRLRSFRGASWSNAAPSFRYVKMSLQFIGSSVLAVLEIHTLLNPDCGYSNRANAVRAIRSVVLALLLSLVGAITVTPLSAAPSELPADGTAQSLNLLVNASSSSSVGPPQTPLSLYVPASIDRTRPSRILVILHGMNGSGQELAAPFVEDAERYGWIVVAPTFQFRDWRDTEQTRLDDREKIAALEEIIKMVPTELRLPVRSRVAVFGFSRGAQLAERFAFFHPELVQSVAVSGAGTYTLPKMQADSVPGDLAFPFGVADFSQYTGHAFDASSLRNTPFLVTVGEQDNRATDVPRQWDALLGSTRIERGRTFVQALKQADIPAELRIVPNTDHEVSSGVRSLAWEHFRSSFSD